MKARKKRPRHAFLFKITVLGGKKQTITQWATVRDARRDVYLPLKAEHVRQSIKLQGAGNTQTCSMAVCAAANAELFAHPVEGYIDWFYRRAFVVSKVGKNGLPSECYVYSHNDGIGRLNDTQGGQLKLLAELEAAGGERIIHLLPIKKAKPRPGRARGKRDGSRTKVQPRGAKLRFAVAELGGVPA